MTNSIIMYLSKLQLDRECGISKSFKYLILVCLSIIFITRESNAQEIRLSGSMLAVTSTTHPFFGGSLGIESPLGKHFSLVFDANIAPDEMGTWLSFKPSVYFYFKKDKSGFYLGASTAYHHLKESKGEDYYHDGVYALGLDIGVKSRISEKVSWHLTLGPQITFGPWNGNGGAFLAQTGVSLKL